MKRIILKRTRGSNQFKPQRANLRGALAVAGMTTAMLFVLGSRTIDNRFVTAHISSYDIHPVEASEPEPTPTHTPKPTAIPTPKISTDIKQYIKTIFGKDARIACAIARAESGFKTDAQLKSSVENSNGIFQINLESDYAKVHYDRVPGNNLEEKIEWLSDPYNSTLMAYWIYTKSGFNPWSVFTSGKYKQFLGECK
jgi:hypothetical protein